MTFQYKNVYVADTSTVVGPYEADGPLGNYFDDAYDDLYFGTDSWELAEVKLVKDSIKILLRKLKLTKDKVDLVVGGDLLNQITATSYGSLGVGQSFLGVYDACATSVEEIIIASNLIEQKRVGNALCVTSSHNMSSEKQFRNPTEYGAPKPRTATFTATGGASVFLTSKKDKIRVESTTTGKLIDYAQADPNNMGAVMMGAAAYTINKHLKDLDRSPDYYDLIVTGDLGRYGKDMLVQFMKEEYKVDLSKNYNDCGVMLYDL